MNSRSPYSRDTDRPRTIRLSPDKRRRYLQAAEFRQQMRRRKDFSLLLTQRVLRLKRGDIPVRGRRVPDDWLENRERLEKLKTVRKPPAWLLPTVILAAMLLVFYGLLPPILRRAEARLSANPPSPSERLPAEPLYSEDWLAAVRPEVDVFTEPAAESDRITQLLYNEPALRLGPEQNGFIPIRLENGTEGWCRLAELTENTVSLEPAGRIARIVVTDLSKRIFSHARNGNLVAEVKMGTELFAIYNSGPLYQVILPGGSEGWLDSTGVLALDTDARIDEAGAPWFASSVEKFNYALLNTYGRSGSGLSVPGAIQTAAKVNGITVLPGLDGVMRSGSPVPELLEEGTLNTLVLERGDILILGEAGGRGAVDCAVWLGSGRVLAAVPREFVMREIELPLLLETRGLEVLAARRLFASSGP